MSDDDDIKGKTGGSQTLMRGLDVIEAVAAGTTEIAEIAARLDLTKSTAYRLATNLVERRYLSHAPGLGYRLGPALLRLGFEAQRQFDLVQVARPHLEALARSTCDTVHLGVLDGDRALYLDKIPGSRRVTIGSRVGERHPLTTTGLGKALLLDTPKAGQDHALAAEKCSDPEAWRRRLQIYVAGDFAFDLEENEDHVRCVAAPIRDASGRIVAAISLSSATQYMSDARMLDLVSLVKGCAGQISSDMGWRHHQEDD